MQLVSLKLLLLLLDMVIKRRELQELFQRNRNEDVNSKKRHLETMFPPTILMS